MDLELLLDLRRAFSNLFKENENYMEYPINSIATRSKYLRDLAIEQVTRHY